MCMIQDFLSSSFWTEELIVNILVVFTAPVTIILYAFKSHVLNINKVENVKQINYLYGIHSCPIQDI